MNDSASNIIKTRFKLTIEFDGSEFSGWQRQINASRTVQGEIEKALQQILQQKTAVVGSGRTDAGVHALAQVAHVDLSLGTMPLSRLHLALNSLLPNDVQILEIEPAEPHFHARFHAVSRSYRYRIERSHHPIRRRFSWTPPYNWDNELIKMTTMFLTGRHSFKSFCIQRPGETGYFCTVREANWEDDAEGVDFFITADRFLHKMVRGIVGALIDLGRGRYSREDFQKLLDEPTANGAVFVAPPQGLTLLKVEYPPGRQHANPARGE